VLSNTKNNKRDDTDVLRAEDIVPPYKKEHRPGQDLPTTQANLINKISSQKIKKQTLNETASSPSISQKQHSETSVSEHSDAAQKVNEIPTFNLAEQIMAEQRKITSIRRKAPGQKAKVLDRQSRIESTGYSIEPPRSLSEKERIIAEIVARDIDKLCRGDSSSLRNW
jgi:hypothetical protein